MVSSNKYGVGDITTGTRASGALRWSGTIKIKTEKSWTSYVRPDHAIRSSVANTKLQLGRDIRKKMKNKKEKSDFLEIIFL